MVRILLEAGANVNAATRVGSRSALQLAADRGHAGIVRMLLEAGANVNSTDSTYEGYTALYVAVKWGYLEVALELLRAGADVNLRTEGAFQESALVVAAKNGKLDMIHVLINNNPDMVKLRADCKNAAIEARDYGHTIIAGLLERHAQKLSEKLDENLKHPDKSGD
ncbi:hypothetical protein MMC10_005710 [Thelotrema lepadinum]|nr:hypothetical protein [Thelotrema lepadinum]